MAVMKKKVREEIDREGKCAGHFYPVFSLPILLHQPKVKIGNRFRH